MSSKVVEACHQFVSIISPSPLSGRWWLKSTSLLTSKPYPHSKDCSQSRIGSKMNKRRAVVGPLPISAFLTNIEVVWPLFEDNGNHALIPCNWDWDEKLKNALQSFWHNIGECSSKSSRCGDLLTCKTRRRLRHPNLSWRMCWERFLDLDFSAMLVDIYNSEISDI